MRHVQFGRGTTEQEDVIVGVPGELRIDLTRGEPRIHDGIKQGGFRIPNADSVQTLLAQLSGGGSGKVAFVSALADLTNLSPDTTTVAICSEAGKEDVYIWHAGAADQGAITSAIAGSWHLLDAQAGFMIRMWRAGLIALQVGGAAPVASQDTTAWINGTAVYMYNGTTYLVATPVLFARMLAYVGGYYTTTLSLPNRIAVTETDLADLNTATLSGWYRSTTSATHSPVAGVHSLMHWQIDTVVDTAVQEFFVQASSTFDRYIRYKVAGAWGSWQVVTGVLPTRLGPLSSTIADANSTAGSGWYNMASGGSNMPVAANGTLVHIDYDSTNASQFFIALSTKIAYVRTKVASSWGAWGPVTDAATAAQVNAGTAGKAIMADVAQSAAAWYAQAYGGTLTFDHANGPNQSVTLTGNPTVALPTNPKVGLPLTVAFLQDATGSRVPAFAANFDFGDYGTPVLSTGANQEDVLSFMCRTTTKFVFMGMRKRTD